MTATDAGDVLLRGLLDTSVVIDLDVIDPAVLPEHLDISAVTLAELSDGPHATDDAGERARRQDLLQRTQETFDPLPFGGDEARAYGRVTAAIRAADRRPGRRVADLLIAATALAQGLPLLTRNGDDFQHLDDLVDVVVC